MDGYSHLSIEKREDIMVCWKGHEGISQIRGSSDGPSRPYLARSGATDGRGLPRIERAEACGCKAAALQAPGSWTIRIGARWSVRLMLASTGHRRRYRAASRCSTQPSTASFQGTGRPQGCSGTMESADTARVARGAQASCASPTTSRSGRKQLPDLRQYFGRRISILSTTG